MKRIQQTPPLHRMLAASSRDFAASKKLSQGSDAIGARSRGAASNRWRFPPTTIMRFDRPVPKLGQHIDDHARTRPRYWAPSRRDATIRLVYFASRRHKRPTCRLPNASGGRPTAATCIRRVLGAYPSLPAHRADWLAPLSAGRCFRSAVSSVAQSPPGPNRTHHPIALGSDADEGEINGIRDRVQCARDASVMRTRRAVIPS